MLKCIAVCDMMESIFYCIGGIMKIEFRNICEIPTLEKFVGYSVSTSGDIWSSKSGKILSDSVRTGNGVPYKVISLRSSDGKRRKFSIHRLVAMAFKFNDNHANLTVNHIDENSLHNHIDNLEWMTIGENIRYSQAGKCYSGDPDELAIEFNNSGMTMVDFSALKGVPMNTMWDVVNRISNVGSMRKRRIFSEDLKTEILEYLSRHTGKEAAIKFKCSQSMISKIRKDSHTGGN